MLILSLLTICTIILLLHSSIKIIILTAPGVHHLEALSELEQRLFYTRVLCTNFSFLYEHLNTPAILAALGERELIDLEGVEDTKIYSGKHAQNTLAIHEMQLIKAPPNCIEKLCEILNQDHVARTLYSGKTCITLIIILITF